MDESKHLNDKAHWYLDGQLDFDKKLIEFRHRTIKSFFRGQSWLEMGPADGVMTRLLLEDCTNLTVVDAAAELLKQIPDRPKLSKVLSLFEDFAPERKFDTVIMEHILEHVEDPAVLLQRTAKWVARGGCIIAGVPNGLSFHRLAAVKMGLLGRSTDLNDRDKAQGHRRVYTPETFKADLVRSGLRVVHEGGVYFKPLSNQQIQDHWNPAMVEGFYLLGLDFPRHAADIFAVCEPL